MYIRGISIYRVLFYPLDPQLGFQKLLDNFPLTIYYHYIFYYSDTTNNCQNKENTTNASEEQPSCSKDSNKNDQILHIESKKRLSSDDLSTGTSAAPPVKKARKLPDWMLNMEDTGNENKSPVKVKFSDFNMRMGLIYFLNSLSFNTLGLDYEICWSQSFIKMLSDYL